MFFTLLIIFTPAVVQIFMPVIKLLLFMFTTICLTDWIWPAYRGNMNMKVGGWNINYFFYLVGHESSLMLQASCEGTEGYLVLPGIKIIAGKGLKR